MGPRNPVFLPPLERLWDYQAGYRWNGVTNERVDDWPDEWLVVADIGADPFIFDSQTNRVLFAEHGQGKWDARELFVDLNEMGVCLGTLGNVNRDIGEFEDEDGLLNETGRKFAMSALAAFVDVRKADDLLFAFGWGFSAASDVFKKSDSPGKNYAEIRRQFELKEACTKAKVEFQNKKYAAVVKLLGPFESDLDKLLSRKLEYSRKNTGG